MGPAPIVVACLVVVMTAVPSGRAARLPSDPITAWSIAASEAATASAMAPFRTPISLAILHLAMYDAVNAVTEEREPYLAKVAVVRPASPHAAAIEAGYRVLVAEFPAQRAQLAARHSALLADVQSGPARESGVSVGASVASQLLAARANDGRTADRIHTPGPGAGVWIPTPPGFRAVTSSFLARVAPFTMTTASQFRPAGPPQLGSVKWAEEYNEVKALGGKHSVARTREQTATALFWEPLAGTVWPVTIRRLAAEHALELPSSAHFQAAAFAAFADALISCWDAKFHFNFWRPITAIQAGERDGNDGTGADASWEPLTVTPDFPEYPSGHACATAAVAYTIESFFPHAPIPARHAATGKERVYQRAKDVVDEVIEARMLVGVHFRSADVDGAEMGRQIAEQIQRQRFMRRP
jgi:hypothetical protein